jgi:LacI family transcriptional regulator
MTSGRTSVTIADLAQAVGVAKSTVSLAFSAPSRVKPETLARILEAAERVGYEPNVFAQSLRTGRHNLVGLLTNDIRSPWHSAFFAAAQGRAIEEGYLVLGATSLDDAKRELAILAQFRAIRVRGALITTSEGISAADIRFAEPGVPVVTFDQKVEGLECDHVSLDHRHATRELTRLLLQTGHTRIGHVCGRRGLWSSDERLEGVREAMADAGLVLEAAAVEAGDFKEDRSQTAALRLLDRADRPTAIVAANAGAAIGTLRAIRQLGLQCPGDVSLVTVDGLPEADLVSPHVTAAVQPVEDMARLAMDWLIERVSGRGRMTPARVQCFEATIVRGDSVALPPVRMARSWS